LTLKQELISKAFIAFDLKKKKDRIDLKPSPKNKKA
jgi:hypothetical protein